MRRRAAARRTPLLLDTFYSNEKAKQTLVSMIGDGRLSHALLLEGEDGCGKTTFARMVAAAYLCQGQERPCGQCRSCRLVMSDAHPDVMLAASENRARGFHIEEIRRIRSTANILPNDGDRKVYILPNVHNMTEQAQNAMLKLIEEPPRGVFFLLTCNNRARLLPTILSRVTLIPISPCSPEECLAALEQLEPQAPPEQREQVARLCGGNLGRARAMLGDQALLELHRTAWQAGELICVGEEFALLGLLWPYTGAKKREELLRLLEVLKDYFVELIRQKSRLPAREPVPERVLNRTTTLQAAKIVAIIDSVTAQVAQNVGSALAVARLCGECRSVLEQE